MVKIFDFSSITREFSRKTLLDQLENDPDYSWVTDLLKETTDELALLDLRPTDDFSYVLLQKENFKTKYNPAYIGDNLSAGLDALNRALIRRTEIQSLESQSITLAMQYLLEDSQRAEQFDILRLHVLSSAVTSGEPPEKYLDAINRQKKIQEEVHQARLRTHLADGSALNFAQRVGFLRSLYVIDFVDGWLRLKSAFLGIKTLLIDGEKIKCEAPPYPEGSSSDLIKLLQWANRAIQNYASIRHHEYETVVGVSLISCVSQPQDLYDQISNIKNGVPAVIKFNIDKKKSFHLRNVVAISGVDVILESGSAELTSIESQDKAYLFSLEQEKRNSERRRTQTLSLRVYLNLPLQGTNESEMWSCPAIVLNSVILKNEGRSQDLVSFSDSSAIGRVNPDGIWRMTFGTDIEGRIVEDLRTLFSKPTSSEPSVKDIRLYFRCICRQ